MKTQLRLFAFCLRLFRLKIINKFFLDNRISFNGLVLISSGVKIILEPDAELVFKGRFSLKNDTIIYVKKNAKLILGQNSSTGHHTEISVSNNVVIGDDVIMGAYTYITDSNHSFDLRGISIRNQGMEVGCVNIGNNVWIGRNAMVLKNAGVGDNSVVAAGAVVTKMYGPNVILGGVPGKILKELR